MRRNEAELKEAQCQGGMWGVAATQMGTPMYTVPEPLFEAAVTAFQESNGGNCASAMAQISQEVSAALKAMNIKHDTGYSTQDGLFSLEVFIPESMVSQTLPFSLSRLSTCSRPVLAAPPALGSHRVRQSPPASLLHPLLVWRHQQGSRARRSRYRFSTIEAVMGQVPRAIERGCKP